MSDQAFTLYSEVFLQHGRQPRHLFMMSGATHEAIGHNPMCGDKVHMYAKIVDGHFDDISFLGEGCILCIGSSSLVTEIMMGEEISELEFYRDKLETMLRAEKVDETELLNVLPLEDSMQPWQTKLQPYKILKAYPTRQKCALLAWNTLMEAVMTPKLQGSEPL